MKNASTCRHFKKEKSLAVVLFEYVDVNIGLAHRYPASVTMGPVSRWSGDTETRSAVTQHTDRVMLLQPPGSDFYMLPHTLRT